MNFLELSYKEITELSIDEIRVIANNEGISCLIKIETIVKKTKCGGTKYSEEIVGTKENIEKYEYIINRLKRVKKDKWKN